MPRRLTLLSLLALCACDPDSGDTAAVSGPADGGLAGAVHRRIQADSLRFDAVPGGFTARGGGLSAIVDARGLTARRGDDELALALTGWGRGDAREALDEVAPVAGAYFPVQNWITFMPMRMPIRMSSTTPRMTTSWMVVCIASCS